MKRDILAIGLITVLIASTLATAGLCYRLLKMSRTMPQMQGSVNHINRNRQALQSLAVELNEYARSNPSINPLLQQMNLRIRTATNAPAGGGR
jgi:hypothetical protein